MLEWFASLFLRKQFHHPAPSAVPPIRPLLEPSQYVDFIRAVLLDVAGLKGETEGIQVLVFSCYFNDGDLRCYASDDHTWSQRGRLLRNVTVSWKSFVEALETAFAIGASVDLEKPYPILIARGLVPYGSGCDRYYCVIQCMPEAVRTKRKPIFLECECCCCDCDH